MWHASEIGQYCSTRASLLSKKKLKRGFQLTDHQLTRLW
ncbi:hypothetical protein CNE_BB1p11660 (plasmid) [Cupriavidus necator N-1]|uniref:Transposase n=1 Tax=Cupriavidus necator (strain ATCC 43291 / DSM 13513 / CCUG 52238 / LMG 8453 / N-1) TaxID=1042878 RepID=F8GV69_CUPNN|nr:hypothetical protein CNE_BB1p11660 [Cupriavidus necator N-1]